MDWAYRGTQKQRGYDYSHRKRRLALLPFAWGRLCPMCSEVMLPSHKLELDHSVPLARGGTVGDRIVHGVCNRKAGGALGRETQRLRAVKKSRDW